MGDQLLEQNPTLLISDISVEDQTVGTIGRRRLLASLDILTHISGEYIPPPALNFDVVVEESIKEKSEKLVKKLKTTKVPVFQEVQEVHAVAIPKEETTTKEESAHFSNSTAGYT